MEDAAGKPHGKNLRKARISLPDHVYLVTAVTASRKPVFASFDDARKAACCLHDRGVERHAQTLAYVIMPDHMHWLLHLGQEGKLSDVVRLYKAKVSMQLGRCIWQRGFYDRALRDDDDLRGMARYIVANPLRAGLVKTIGEYPHWDAIWL